MDLFSLLADPVRRRIVEVLATSEYDVGTLARKVADERPVTASAVSHQLRILREADFVTFRVDGPSRTYRLAWNAIDRLDAEVPRSSRWQG